MYVILAYVPLSLYPCVAHSYLWLFGTDWLPTSPQRRHHYPHYWLVEQRFQRAAQICPDIFPGKSRIGWYLLYFLGFCTDMMYLIFSRIIKVFLFMLLWNCLLTINFLLVLCLQQRHFYLLERTWSTARGSYRCGCQREGSIHSRQPHSPSSRAHTYRVCFYILRTSPAYVLILRFLKRFTFYCGIKYIQKTLAYVFVLSLEKPPWSALSNWAQITSWYR